MMKNDPTAELLCFNILVGTPAQLFLNTPAFCLLFPTIAAQESIQPGRDGGSGQQIAGRLWDRLARRERFGSHFQRLLDGDGAPVELVERRAVDESFAAAEGE
jgi:hypothetical protein